MKLLLRTGDLINTSLIASNNQKTKGIHIFKWLKKEFSSTKSVVLLSTMDSMYWKQEEISENEARTLIAAIFSARWFKQISKHKTSLK